MKTHYCKTIGLGLIGMVLPAIAAAQQAATSGMTTNATTGGCTGDKVKVESFSVTPSNPTLNQAITVKLSFKNLCNQALTVPFKITDSALGAAFVVKTVSVPAGQTYNYQGNWTGQAGRHAWDAYLDSDKTLNESASALANNGAPSVIEYTIAPPLDTQLLDYGSAQQAGAQFNIAMAENGGCLVKELKKEDGFTFRVELKGGPPCGNGTFEAFANFSLKNGWKVKSVEVTQPSGNTTNSAWEWVTRPAAGATSPTAKLRAKTENNTFPLVAVYRVKIQIEGPQGTSPY
jgi:hypothetical protein